MTKPEPDYWYTLQQLHQTPIDDYNQLNETCVVIGQGSETSLNMSSFIFFFDIKEDFNCSISSMEGAFDFVENMDLFWCKDKELGIVG